MKKAIFLDRDGVINQAKIIDGKPYSPNSIDELILLPKVFDALKILKKAGFFLFVITNQPDVSRGFVKKKSIEKIHKFLKKIFPIDDIFVCFHDDDENCNCRKPNPGNIYKAIKKYNIDISSSFIIGDRWKDIEAGKKVGCKTIFIDYNYKEKRPVSFDFKVNSLYDASKIIINQI
jgi:D-glycero-D-manno-heptose 1,7-bisphosphate phosphatase